MQGGCVPGPTTGHRVQAVPRTELRGGAEVRAPEHPKIKSNLPWELVAWPWNSCSTGPVNGPASAPTLAAGEMNRPRSWPFLLAQMRSARACRVPRHQHPHLGPRMRRRWRETAESTGHPKDFDQNPSKSVRPYAYIFKENTSKKAKYSSGPRSKNRSKHVKHPS